MDSLWEEKCKPARQDGQKKSPDEPVHGKLEGVIPRPSINEIDGGMATEAQEGADMRMMRTCGLRVGARMSEK